MAVERLTKLVAFRIRHGAFLLGGAMSHPVFGGPARGLAALRAFASGPEVYDLSHDMLDGLRNLMILSKAIRANCADTVTPPATGLFSSCF
jgi:hypothetical protein